MSVTSDLDSISISFDSADFEIDLLDEMDLLGDVFELSRTTSPVQEQSEPKPEVQSEDNRRVRTTKKRNPKRVAKHTSSSTKFDVLERIEYERVTPEPEEQHAVAVISEADLYFRSRFLALYRREMRPYGALPDSVYYFPAAMVGCLNSGDNIGLADLLHFTTRAECDLGLYCFNSRLSQRSFLKFFEVMNLIHPDKILSLSDAVVERNRVTTSATLQFTDCKMLFDIVSKTVNEPEIMSIFSTTRQDHLKRRLYVAGRSEEEQQQFVSMVESDDNLIIQGSIQIHVTFDEITNKVSGLYLSGGLVSAHPAVEVVDD